MTNFLSTCLKEVYKLLKIRKIQTSPLLSPNEWSPRKESQRTGRVSAEFHSESPTRMVPDDTLCNVGL